MEGILMKFSISEDFFKKLSREQKRKAEKTFDWVISREGEGKLFPYLQAQNAKKLKGGDGTKFKLRVSASDRISFSYTEKGSNEQSECITFLEYLTHDDQSRAGKTKIGYVNMDNLKVIDPKNIEDYVYIDENQSEPYAKNRSKYIVLTNNDLGEDMSDFIDSTNEEREVYLSPVQRKILHEWNASIPLFIGGSAGSGKSILAVQMLYKYQTKLIFQPERKYDKSGSAVYFTLSDELIKQAKERYRIICKNNDLSEDRIKARFENLLKYCAKEAGIDMDKDKDKDKIKTFELFNSDFLSKYPKHKVLVENLNISPIEIWKEIRGTIKGYMGSNWSKKYWLNKLDFGVETINFLEKAHLYIKSTNNNKEFYVESKKLYKFIKLNNSLDGINDDILKDLNKIYNIYKNIDINNYAMSRDDYLNFSPESSLYGNKYIQDVYDQEQRNAIYDLFEEYEKWLKCNQCYDENDLAVKLLNKYNPKFQINETKDKPEYPFEFIVIDEAQDLTQIQIYSLYHLVEDKAKIVFAGDEHQIINPTMFTIKDIYALFSSDSKRRLSLDRKYIIHNFRSQKNIVDLANHMSEIRRRHIAKSDDETEQNIESVTDNGVKPFYLSYSDKNASEIIRSLKQYPDTAIIVADENIKNELTTRYGKGQIFTVLDIKGLEFKYVLCYGLLGEYRQIWEEILNSGQAKNNSRYRYYFNIFYVAITRAKEYLCLIDPKTLCLDLENEIMPYVKTMEDFSFDSLCISTLINTSEAWYESASRLEQAEHYDEAILQYKNSNETSEMRNTEKAIKRCEAKKLRTLNEFKKAWFISIEIDDFSLAQNMAESLGDEKLILLTKIMNNSNDQKSLKTQDTPPDKLIAYAAQNNDEIIILLNKYYNEKFINGIVDKIEQIKNNYKNLTGVKVDGKN